MEDEKYREEAMESQLGSHSPGDHRRDRRNALPSRSLREGLILPIKPSVLRRGFCTQFSGV